MITSVQIYVIDCDMPGCDGRFMDAPSGSQADAELSARLRGWEVENEYHVCPACVRNQKRSVKLGDRGSP